MGGNKINLKWWWGWWLNMQEIKASEIENLNCVTTGN